MPTPAHPIYPCVAETEGSVKSADTVITLPKEAWGRDVAFGVVAWARFQAIVGSARGKGRFMCQNSRGYNIVSRVLEREQCATRKLASAALATERSSSTLKVGVSRTAPIGQG